MCSGIIVSLGDVTMELRRLFFDLIIAIIMVGTGTINTLAAK